MKNEYNRMYSLMFGIGKSAAEGDNALVDRLNQFKLTQEEKLKQILPSRHNSLGSYYSSIEMREKMAVAGQSEFLVTGMRGQVDGFRDGWNKTSRHHKLKNE